jgi:hypothetical protein
LKHILFFMFSFIFEIWVRYNNIVILTNICLFIVSIKV